MEVDASTVEDVSVARDGVPVVDDMGDDDTVVVWWWMGIDEKSTVRAPCKACGSFPIWELGSSAYCTNLYSEVLIKKWSLDVAMVLMDASSSFNSA